MSTPLILKQRVIPFVAILLLSSAASLADELQGRVVSVADGDTITILDESKTQHKIRLKGIDAPEKGQAFGQASKKNLSGLIFGKIVTVEFSKRDRYGRIVGRVMLDAQDIYLEQVNAGLAWHFKEYEREQPAAERKQYAQAEDGARQARRGLWLEASPVPPWEFRREQRSR